MLQVHCPQLEQGPGVRGAGPKGRERGDTEQWEFPPNIVLEEWEKREIIGTVVEIATRAMLNLHFYTFGGKLFRGKCAVA